MRLWWMLSQPLSPTEEFHMSTAIHTTWAASRLLLSFLVLQKWRALHKHTVRGSPWAGPYRQNRLDSNKQKRKSLPGPGSPVWDEIHRKKHSSISPLSLSCSIHTSPCRLSGQFTHWDQPQLLAAASVTGRSESPCMLTGSIFLQDETGSDFSSSCQLKHLWLQIRNKTWFSSVLPYRPNWLIDVPKEHLESRSCKSHLRDRRGQSTPCLSRLFRRNISNCDFDFHRWDAAFPLQAEAPLKTEHWSLSCSSGCCKVDTIYSAIRETPISTHMG